MLIPNFFLDRYTNHTDFKIACRLYGMIGSFTKRNSKGYELSVKEKTLADSCGCSTATVRRSVSRLQEDGIIISKYRRRRSDGTLGAYVYTIKDFDCRHGFFSLNKRAFSQLSGKAFFVYALFCKLKGGSCNSFYQSINDIGRMVSIKRSELISIIARLVELGLVYKQRKRTKCGDYTDNTYFVVVYVKNTRIYKKKSHRSAKAMTRKYKPDTYINNIIDYNTTYRKNSHADYVNKSYVFDERSG